MTPKGQLVLKKESQTELVVLAIVDKTICTQLLPTSLSTGNKAKNGLPVHGVAKSRTRLNDELNLSQHRSTIPYRFFMKQYPEEKDPEWR